MEATLKKKKRRKKKERKVRDMEETLRFFTQDIKEKTGENRR